MKKKHRTGIFLFLCISLLLPVLAGAAEYYVAPSGSDSNPGTLSQPWKTVKKAAGTLRAGDTAYFRAGTYQEYNVTFSNSGSSGSPITLKGYPGETAVIDGANYGIVFEIQNRDYITLDSLTIRRGNLANIRIAYDYPATGITIQNCDLKEFVANDNSATVYINTSGAENILIQNNVIHDVQGYHGNAAGIIVFKAGTLTIRNNVIYTTNIGIYYKHSTSNGKVTTIENNLIYDQDRWGILVSKSDAVIRNNVIRDTVAPGIQIFEESADCSALVSSNNQILHNTIVNNESGIILERSTSCQGAYNTMVKDNLIYTVTGSEFRGLSVWPYYSGSDGSRTTFDHNLLYSSNLPSPVRVLNSFYPLSSAPLSGSGNLQTEPLFRDYANKDLTLQPSSPGKGAASDGKDMGADMALVGIRVAPSPPVLR
ncbi:MAG: right-handed parallel beta-helix repeat-containing protein [Thermodesulfovibrionales bacterium]